MPLRYTRLMYSYEYPRPGLTADVVALRGGAASREVLLMRRRFDPFEGGWALPGGYVEEYELPEDAARRELAEETGVELEEPFRLVGVFGKRGRDPRGWTVTAAYAVTVKCADIGVEVDDDALEARWFRLDELPPLAFDHAEIVEAAITSL